MGEKRHLQGVADGNKNKIYSDSAKTTRETICFKSWSLISPSTDSRLETIRASDVRCQVAGIIFHLGSLGSASAS